LLGYSRVVGTSTPPLDRMQNQSHGSFDRGSRWLVIGELTRTHRNAMIYGCDWRSP
jgi:hypothetical protein